MLKSPQCFSKSDQKWLRSQCPVSEVTAVWVAVSACPLGLSCDNKQYETLLLRCVRTHGRGATSCSYSPTTPHHTTPHHSLALHSLLPHPCPVLQHRLLWSAVTEWRHKERHTIEWKLFLPWQVSKQSWKCRSDSTLAECSGAPWESFEVFGFISVFSFFHSFALSWGCGLAPGIFPWCSESDRDTSAQRTSLWLWLA